MCLSALPAQVSPFFSALWGRGGGGGLQLDAPTHFSERNPPTHLPPPQPTHPPTHTAGSCISCHATVTHSQECPFHGELVDQSKGKSKTRTSTACAPGMIPAASHCLAFMAQCPITEPCFVEINDTPTGRGGAGGQISRTHPPTANTSPPPVGYPQHEKQTSPEPDCPVCLTCLHACLPICLPAGLRAGTWETAPHGAGNRCSMTRQPAELARHWQRGAAQAPGAELVLGGVSAQRGHSQPPPPPNRRRNPNKSADRIGEPIFQQNRFPVPWISVPGPKHTFLLVAL